MKTINIAIVGHGYVGKAVDHGFSTTNVVKHLIDPLYNTDISDLPRDIDAAFVCVPTPFGADGQIDASIVRDVVNQLSAFNCPIIIKSTVVPGIVHALQMDNHKVVYNPEFLTEANALADFVNPPMHIFGGHKRVTKMVERLYEKYSQCNPAPVMHMTAREAAFVKYGINSFLATKVLWFNQYKDVIDEAGANFNVITNAMKMDPRIGTSHMQVPGPEGKRGYGGACFPKDTSALANHVDFPLLDKVIELNNQYRSQYELDDREKEQKVVYI